MKQRLKCNKKNDRIVESLPKIYLVGYWARYGVMEYPFANKYYVQKENFHECNRRKLGCYSESCYGRT